MDDVRSLLEEARVPFGLGNVRVPAGAILDRLRATASRFEKRLIYAELRHQLRNPELAVTPTELTWLHTELKARSEEPPFDAEHARLLADLSSIEVKGEPPLPGRANILAVSGQPFRRAPFGVVQPLHIRAWPAGAQTVLNHQSDDESVRQGFDQAVWAAQDFLRREIGQYWSALLMQLYTVHGTFPRLRGVLPVVGPSMGLGTAVAVVSSLIDAPVPDDIAFTGRVDMSGSVVRVESVDIKVRAARDKGLQRAFVPADNVRDVSLQVRQGIAVCGVTRLADVLGEVFGARTLAQGVRRLHDTVLPTVQSTAGSPDRPAPLVVEGQRRVLLTAVGRADPFGQSLDKNRRPLDNPDATAKGNDEGPILTIVKELRPHEVYLLYTTVTPHNDFSEKAGVLRRFLETADPTCSVIEIPLDTVTDPSDLHQLQPAFGSAVSRAVGGREGVACYVNVASGTQQMGITWHLLKAWGRLDARLLQVRESRYVTKLGDSRVREVTLPAPEMA